MGRWTQYDEDEYRLPEGMKRVGYDADTGRYHFRDGGGRLYQGPEGSEFGQLTPVSSAPIAISNNDDDPEAPPVRSDGYQPLATDGFSRHTKYHIDSPYRMLFPFFLGIGVILLLVWRLVVSPGLETPKSPCLDPHTRLYIVQPGDNCWGVAQAYECPWDTFKTLNPKLDCEHLMPGTSMCVCQPDIEV